MYLSLVNRQTKDLYWYSKFGSECNERRLIPSHEGYI